MADPWLKFYPTDWRSDPALRMCSAAARGVWIDLICLMHEATPYGHLLVNGRCPTDAQVAVLTGTPPDQLTQCLRELEDAGVFSRTKDGTIYSRKLTRMAKKAATARNNGRKGGNPTLGKREDNSSSDNLQVKGGVKPQKLEARDQSSSVSKDTGVPPPKVDPEKVMFDAGVSLLMASGKSQRDARSMVGMWRKQHGAEAVISAIGRAQREAPVDATAFMQGIFRQKRKAGPEAGSERVRDGQREVYEPAVGAWVPQWG